MWLYWWCMRTDHAYTRECVCFGVVEVAAVVVCVYFFLCFVLLYHCSSFGSSRGCCLVRTQPVNCDVIYFNSNLLFLLYIHAHVTLVLGQL